MKIHIYEEDKSLLKLYEKVMSVKGHQVQGFTNKYNCPCLSSKQHSCPCVDQSVDAIIVDTRLMSPDLELLTCHGHKDCHRNSVKFAVIGTAFSDEQKESIERLGHVSLKKPFSLSELNEWIDSCVE